MLGLGQMGRTCAQRLAANGYRVAGWSRSAAKLAGSPPSPARRARAVLAAADIVVNLLPLTPATRGLFDARRFAQMRRGAALVNLARGAHVVEADLLAALDGGRLRPCGARRVPRTSRCRPRMRSGAIRASPCCRTSRRRPIRAARRRSRPATCGRCATGARRSTWSTARAATEPAPRRCSASGTRSGARAPAPGAAVALHRHQHQPLQRLPRLERPVGMLQPLDQAVADLRRMRAAAPARCRSSSGTRALEQPLLHAPDARFAQRHRQRLAGGHRVLHALQRADVLGQRPVHQHRPPRPRPAGRRACAARAPTWPASTASPSLKTS